MTCRNQQLGFFKTDQTATIPYRETVDSVGYDLFTKDNGEYREVPSEGKARIELGLRVFIPAGCYGRIAPRSGLSWDQHTIISAGVVDPGYGGELKVVIFNHAKEDLIIEPGEKIAQLILERCEMPPVYEAKVDPQTGSFVFEMMDELGGIRGARGFGSSGKKKLLTVDEHQQGSSNKNRSSSPEEGEISSEEEKGEEKEEEELKDLIIIDEIGDDGEFREEEEEKISRPVNNHQHYRRYNSSISRPRFRRHHHHHQQQQHNGYRFNNAWNNTFSRATHRNRRMRRFFNRK